MVRYFSAMSTLDEIQEAVTKLNDDEKKALSLWLVSQTTPELSVEDEQRLRSLDEAIRDVDAARVRRLKKCESWFYHGLSNSLCALTAR